ncbi:MAG TPA: hypothetical protein VGL56_21135 [Fimbriimonadaceae bacterium]|jgi:hypothetical protein
MIGIIAFACMQASTPKPQVIAASIFKNGYTLLVREVPVQGSGEITLTDLPHPSLGTFWISASDGIQIEDVIRRQDISKEKRMRNAGVFTDILDANLGKVVRLTIIENGSNKTVEGKLLTNQGDIVLVRTTDETLALLKSKITDISAPGGNLAYQVPDPPPFTDVVDIKFNSKGSGKIYLVGIESGMIWTPGYSLDISDKKNVHLTAKATVVNDLAELKDIDAQFVSGFPNVPFLGQIEPFLSSQVYAQENFGGGGRAGFALQNAPAAAPTARDESNTASSFATGEEGTQNEDLYFYKHPHMTLKSGERGYYILFDFTAPYNDLYTVDLPNTVSDNTNYQLASGVPDVWHTIRFKDQTKEPLTTGTATVFQDGQVLGQDTLTYTSIGATADVKMAKALDVHADQDEIEVSRERGALKLWNGIQLDLVTVKGSVQLESYKSGAVKLQVTKLFTGELVSADHEPTSTKVAKNLQEANPHGRLQWTITLNPKEKATLTYTYKLYVRPN